MARRLPRKPTWLAIICLLASSPIAANLPDSYGYGSYHIGLSGAGSALANDWSATYYNLAGLAAPAIKPRVGSVRIRKQIEDSNQFQQDSYLQQTDQKGSKIKLKRKRTKEKKYHSGGETNHQLGNSIIYQHSLMNIDINNGSSLAKSNAEIALQGMNYAMMNLGFIFDLRSLVRTPYNVPIRLGVALALNADGSVSKLTDLSQKNYDFQKLGRNPQRISTMFGIGFQVWPERLSLGVGLNNLAKGKGKALITDVSFDKSKPPKPSTKVDVKGFAAPMAGLMYRHPISNKSSFSASATFRHEIFLASDIDVNAELELASIKTETKTSIITFFTPHTFVFGMAYVYKTYRVMLDLEYQKWSDFRLSSTRAVGEEPPEFKDIIVTRLGGEYPIPVKFLRMKGRVGYAFIPAYTPDQTSTSNYLDNAKHVISLGVSILRDANFIFKHRTRIDIGIQYQLWATRETVKEVQDELADGTNQPGYSYGGNVLIASIGSSWKF